MSDSNLSASQKAGLEFLAAVASEQPDFINTAAIAQTVNIAVQTVQLTAQVTAAFGGSSTPGSVSSGSAGKGASLAELLRSRAG
jgi:hypothetical protein